MSIMSLTMTISSSSSGSLSRCLIISFSDVSADVLAGSAAVSEAIPE